MDGNLPAQLDGKLPGEDIGMPEKKNERKRKEDGQKETVFKGRTKETPWLHNTGLTSPMT